MKPATGCKFVGGDLSIKPFEWTCRYCDRDQVVTSSNFDQKFSPLEVGATKDGEVGAIVTGIRCTNPNCNELTLSARLVSAVYSPYTEWQVNRDKDPLESWPLRPQSSAKPQPLYIPAPLREDYIEACLIRDQSPKASATLARRCLQGMIRDFCGISKNRLIDEINTLRDRIEKGIAPKGVEAETIDAIDAIRGVGNIGAHMEKDISLIVEVDPGEAQTLIELIEMLFKEWYVARHHRQERLSRIQSIAKDKQAQLAVQKAPTADAPLAITNQSDS
ncbi:DUF4145 domain-containing protein [Aquamicrobium sp. NLF2-7]|uniref:DUF4145 domain-containing protein n=1 Tax=Aquamicrobium sp. NLF2-7 TaxID=2918753 RepID=UPI001EFB0BA6|nr:DUF4145 domain-containing protein [Aquamicrobium sp. NLF2-7]MCG8272560.1 DUF4145 domain-containing protein [Aquamicrobium sp. NLF2-7]